MRMMRRAAIAAAAAVAGLSAGAGGGEGRDDLGVTRAPVMLVGANEDGDICPADLIEVRGSSENVLNERILGPNKSFMVASSPFIPPPSPPSPPPSGSPSA